MFPVSTKVLFLGSASLYWHPSQADSQAWIEASTKGAVLIFTSAEIEKYAVKSFGVSPATSGMLGGIGGGIAQAYATMGELASIVRP